MFVCYLKQNIFLLFDKTILFFKVLRNVKCDSVIFKRDNAIQRKLTVF